MKLSPRATLALGVWLVLAGGTAAAVYLHGSSADTLGIVNAQEHPVTHASGGTLAEVHASAGQVVKRGELLARVDTQLADANIAAARAALDRAASQVNAAAIDLDRNSFDAERVLRRDVEEAEAELLAARASQRRDEVELRALQTQLLAERQALAAHLVRGEQAAALELRFSAARQAVAEAPRRLRVLEARLASARQSLALWAQTLAPAPGQTKRSDKLQPLVDEVAQRRAELAAAEQERKRADVVAPADGVVTQVRLRAGDVLRGGELLLVLIEQPAVQVTAYADERLADTLTPGQAVQVRRRGGFFNANQTSLTGSVVSVSGAVTMRPARLWANPQFASWGRDVQVSLPAGQPLMPGEVVELHFVSGKRPAPAIGVVRHTTPGPP